MKKYALTFVMLLLGLNGAIAQTSDSLDVKSNKESKKIKLEVPTIKAQMGKDTLKVKFGGAFRFNWRYLDWNEASRKQGSAILYDMARINMGVSYGKIQAAAEYRFYAQSCGGGMLKNGWIGYNINDKNQVRFGLTTVPFGILPYQSNSYFFNINYYIGLEDDDDMGITYQYAGEHWQLNAGYFKNSDLLDGEGSPTNAKRYSYDIAGRTKEVNTGALRVAYKGGDEFKYELGASGWLGQAYNLDSQKSDVRYALAGHAVLGWKNLNLKTQFTHFDYTCEESKNTGYVTMAAFDAPYHVADKGQTYSACLAYTIPINKGVLDAITIYNDYSYLHKTNSAFNDSQQNDFGCSIAAGPVYIYADYITAKNQSWIGPEWNDSFAAGPDNKWHTRVNLNVGIYF